jgi:hypothetical protein
MKRIHFLLCSAVAMLLQTACQAAMTVSIATVTFTNAPADGDTVTINGSVRTFRTSVGAPATEVGIGGTTNITAQNYATQLGTYPYTSISAHPSGGTVYLVGAANVAITASLSGTWGTVSVNTLPLTNYATILPFTMYPPAQRAFMGNLLVDAISTYPTAKISATAPSLGNFFSLSQANVATGSNTFSGPGVFGASNTFNGLVYLNGASYVQGTLKLTNEVPLIEFHESDGTVDKRRSWLLVNQNGLTLTFLNDAGSSSSNVFSIDRNSTYGALEAIFRTRLKADLLYDTTLSNILSTNGVFLHTTAAQIASIMGTGNFAISNTAPTLTVHDTDASSGSQKFLLKADANVLHLAFADDAGAIPLSPRGDVFTVSRTHGTDATGETLNFYPLVQFNGGMSVATGNINAGTGLLQTANGVMIGTSAGTTLPTGASQVLLLAAGAGPSGTPSGYSIHWSSGGEEFYQNGASGEGDTVPNRLHIRTATVLGAGTDYSLTASTAFVDFGTTDPKITLPTSGTYFIFAEEAITAGASANDDFRAKLRDETTSTDLSGSDQEINYLGISQLGTLKMTATTTAAAGDVIAIWSHNNTAARGSVNSARTRIGYIRLY